MITNEPDAIIIGAGHNSLACASHLAAKGWYVLVLEKAEISGGAVKSGNYTGPGFKHDWAAMNLSLFAGSGFFKKYEKELISHGLELIPIENCFASVFPDNKWLGISNNLSKNLGRISNFSKEDSKVWQGLTENFPDEAAIIFKLLGNKLSYRSLIYLFFSIVRKKGLSGATDFIRFLLMSPRAWLDEKFESNYLKSTLAAWGMHLDFSPDTAGGALFPYLEAMTNQSFGMVLGKGGADTIIKSMISLIHSKEGSVVCNSEVSEIFLENGKAKGIRLIDGKIIKAKRCVIANVSPSALLKLVTQFNNQKYSNALSNFKHAPGTMMIHLSMNQLPDWNAGNELKEFAYVHIAPSLEQMAKTYQQAIEGLLPDRPIIVVGQPTSVDNSRAPFGKHTLWIQVRMVPGQITGDAIKQIMGNDWSEIKDTYAERVLDIIEEYAPKTKEKIIKRRVVSPIELEKDNPNLVFGDQICGSHHLMQHFIFRPVRGYTDGSTPIPNLYHTGAAIWPGAGTGAGSGYLLGRKLAGD
jgi:phytoene dehydrogenase-like protein